MIGLYSTIAVIAICIAIIALNTWVKKPTKRKAEQASAQIGFDEAALAKKLSRLIQFRTLTSKTKTGVDADAFLGLHKFLEQTYPLLHKTLEKEVVSEYSLLYKWAGSGSDRKPFLMMAHMDVVPVDERTVDKWKYDAFSGQIADGYVWGRGTLDMKCQLAAIMESVERLIGEGFEPQRDIYIALGHDEESTGYNGARVCAALLKKRGVHFDFVLDEGGLPMHGAIMNVNAFIAAVGICEKGYADVKLTAMSKGGHASRPPKQTAVGALSKAIVAIEKHQMKPTLNETMMQMIDKVGGYMKFPLNVITANLWLFKRVLLMGLAAGSTGAAMVRTTMAPTMLKGSPAPNVMAEIAEAVLNCRIAPDCSVSDVIAHMRKVIKNDEIEIEVLEGFEAGRVSSTDSEGFGVVSRTIEEIFDGYVVTPYLMVAVTDSHLYGEVTDNTYLFQPFRSIAEDLNTMHAANERVSVESLAEGAEFFVRLVKNADG